MARLFSQQWIRINVNAVPKVLWTGDLGNREMKMIVSRAGVSRIADKGNGFALPGEVAFRQAVAISIQMRVVIDELAVHAQLIDGCAAARALK